ncbi:MAG: DUF4423 domain-containing protein [Bdellovibrionota bacterium]
MSNSKIQAEVLRAIRGKLTTSAFSAKLGYRFNQYARWEKGDRRLMWTDFVAVCETKKLPIARQVSLYLGYEGDLGKTDALTKTLLHGFSIDEVSKATEISRSKISRWVNGKASPAFGDVYDLLNWGVNVLAFLEPLVDLEKVPSLAKRYEQFKLQRELVFTMPHLDALQEALLVRRYEKSTRHDSRILAEIAGLPVDVVDRSLEALLETKQVEKKSGKYRMTEIGVDYRADKKRMAKILAHWLRQTTAVVERVTDKPIERSLVGFSVFSLSADAHEKASNLLREFVRGMHTIGSEDKGPKDGVFVFTTSLVDAERFGDS